MTYIYLKTPDGGQLLTLRSTDCWYLRCGIDGYGDACIYLNVLGNEYEMCCSTEYMQGRPNLDSYAVLEYYTAVIRAIYRHIQENGPEFVDVEAIKRELLPDFWAAWKLAGYVADEMPAEKEVN